VEQIAWDLRQADYPRAMNRALIQDLFNGKPPFEEEQPVNVNFLEGTRLAHDARAQFYGAFLKPGSYFTAHTDAGPKSKNGIYSNLVTMEMNKRMKRSMNYFETFRSKFAMDVLHGVGPSVWENGDVWCPDALGMEDILVPARTLLTMKNLPFFAVYRTFTAPELIKLTNKEKKDPAWNMDLVNECIKWIDDESTALMGNNWQEIWSPEKVSERIKSDGGFYAYDECPTINCFDFYFWNDNGKTEGWSRRIILDSWSTPQAAGAEPGHKIGDFGKGKFLYDGGNRKFAGKYSEIVAFQFADLSSVAPFRYHSVRSLGFLMYAVCHLQNRMRCRFNESVFESLMNYFRVASAEDADRAMYLNLVNRGFVDESIKFVPQAERWQVNAALIELGMGENQRLIEANAASYTQPNNFGQDRTQKTKFQVMAEINASTTLVTSALNQAYRYQEGEYHEIFRRFCKPNSTDPDVRSFRESVLRKGLPEKMLCVDEWEISPSRVMGAGNKTLEMAISEQLLQMRPLFDPDPQREILRDVVLNITDDPARAERLVPIEPLKVSDSVHDAQLASGTLMQGLPVALKTGQNHVEYIQAMLGALQTVIAKCQKSGGMATPDQIQGMQNIAQNIGQHIKVLSQDKNEKAAVAAFEKQLSKLMNFVKAFMQRLQEQMKKQSQQQGQQGDPKDAAKVQAMLMAAKVKADSAQKSHGQKTAQRELSWEKEEARKQKQFEMEQQRENLAAVAEVHRGSLKSVGDE
jgi:ribosomal protein S15P/S13E